MNEQEEFASPPHTDPQNIDWQPGEEESHNLRRPPYSADAEQSVLGGILLDNTVFDQVADLITADDFYIGAHKAIFQGCTALLERGEPADPITLRQYLEKNSELDQVGGMGYVAQLVQTVPTAANIKAYAKLVHDKSVLRELSGQATKIVERIYSGDVKRVDDVLDDAEQRIFGVAERKEKNRSEYHSLKSVLVPVFDRISNMMENKDHVVGVPSGFHDLDKMLAGFQPSDLIIVAGRPSMGKTALAMNFATNAALDAGRPVGVFSLEMSKEQLAARMLASTAKVDAQSMRTGWLQNDEYGKLTRTVAQLSEAPLFVDDTPALSVMAMRSKARRLKREKGIQLIVVDYLQLMRGSSATQDNRVQEISEISQGLKAIAKELSIPVIALSQLSRKVEERPDKRPILSDLRESGSIEQDADVVMFVYREEYYKRNDPNLKGRAEVIIAKQRNGPTGDLPLTFLHQYTRFENFAPREY
ncbi:MAG: replicative DNA helicase [Magnetococcales bacterium]|nr:replicative DNA helicase [Magnetococcales bacterium]NGZ28138.1 replicative DNA helicase [Magnetococcales bacterium]